MDELALKKHLGFTGHNLNTALADFYNVRVAIEDYKADVPFVFTPEGDEGREYVVHVELKEIK